MVESFRTASYEIRIKLTLGEEKNQRSQDFDFTATVMGRSYGLRIKRDNGYYIPLEAYRQAAKALFEGYNGAPQAESVCVIFSDEKFFYINSCEEVDSAFFNSIEFKTSNVQICAVEPE